MTERVDARDVLDTDATTTRAFSGRLVGVFRRSGPDTWDDYVLVETDGGPVDVLAGTPIQVETEGATFRMRRSGEVVRVTWTPGEAEGGADPRVQFLEAFVRRAGPTAEGNLAHWLYGQLDDKPKAND
jgi:hypothetical protein